MGSITLGEHLALLHLVALANDRLEVDGGVLVGLLEFRKLVFFLRGVEGDELLFLGAVVLDTDGICVHISDGTVRLGDDLRTGVGDELLLDTGTYYRRLGGDQRYGLAHHVRSHEGTVGIIVLEERDERSSYGRYLARSDIHEVDLIGRNDGEVGTETGLDLRADERTVGTEGRVTLGNDLLLLVLGGEVDDMIVIEVHDAVFDLTVGGLDET